MNLDPQDCQECDRLVSQYEAATFVQVKIHNQLDIACRLRDRALTRRLTLEAYEITARRTTAREALARHRQSAHAAVKQPDYALAAR